MPDDYRQGMIDGLELALDACEKYSSIEDVKKKLQYFLKLSKEDKFQMIKSQLGAVG
ncbi:MAG: hypothetical protein QXS68_04110 [Candidatus Methanomethylicaceae archaeon]